MQSLEDVKDEELLSKKTRQKKRVRGVLIVLNALLLTYAGYLVVASIVDAVNSNKSAKQGDTICILNKSESNSSKIYGDYINGSYDISDFALYGNYLLTSTSRVNANSFNVGKNIKLAKLVDTTKKGASIGDITTIENIGDTLDSQIDLFSLDKGEYILYDGATFGVENKLAYHYTGEEYLEETIYSFPNESGERKKITVKGKASSPALVIEVTPQKDALPASYYDIVIVKKDDVNVEWFKDTKLKIKEVSSIQEAYKYKSCYAINVVEGNDLIGSSYTSKVNTKSERFEQDTVDGAYNYLDKDDAIRELGGYVFNAGYGMYNNQASIDVMKVKSTSHTGKYTITIGREFENPYDKIKTLFGF